MPDDGSYLDSGVAVAADHPALALVPLATALLAVENIQKVAAFRGTHVGLSFPTPSPVVDVWAFVSVPSTGVSGPSAVPLVVLPVYALVQGVIAAGYLGAIHDALLDRELSFGANVRQHAVPLVGFALAQLVAVLAIVPLATVSPVLLLPAAAGLFVAGYLFYGTPYLVVAADEGLVDALGHSYRLATDGGAYARFFVGLLLAGAVLSALVTAVVVNLGVVGVLVGSVLVAPLGVAVNATAMAVVADVAATPTGGRPPELPPADR